MRQTIGHVTLLVREYDEATFTEEPRREGYGTVAVFVDLYGNRWDLAQMVVPAAPSQTFHSGG